MQPDNLQPEDAIQTFIAEVCDAYDIGAGFAVAYLHYLAETHGLSLVSMAELQALQPPCSGWVESAFSTNRYGRDYLSGLGDDGSCRRLLDVGCGFGGRLVAATERGAETVVGLEKDTTVRAIAAANCADQDLIKDDPDRAIRPISDLDTIDGEYDLILCLNPSAQLSEPEAALGRLAELLAADGLLSLELVNPHSIASVASDPNGAVFALSLLAGRDAVAYYRGIREHETDGGAYPSPWACRELLQDLGLQVRTEIPAVTVEPTTVRQLAEQTIGSFATFVRDHLPRLPAELGAKVDAHVRCWVGMLAEDLCRVASGELSTTWVQNKYLSNRWTLKARRLPRNR